MKSTLTKDIKRVPRPTGSTYISLAYQQDPTTQNKEKLETHLINNYALQGFTMNGQSMDIYQLATYLNMEPTDIMNKVNQIGNNLQGFADPDQLNQTLQTLVTLSTTWALQDKGRIQQQVELLAKSQGDSYKPFISGTLNQALKLSLDSNKNILDLMKTLTPTNNTTNILNIIHKGDEQDTNQDSGSPLLNQEQALQMITEQVNELPAFKDPEQQNRLFKEHNIAATPGCNFGGPEGPIPVVNKAKAQEPHRPNSKERHESRPEALGPINTLYSDDAEVIE